jgi:hypothetical protein
MIVLSMFIACLAVAQGVILRLFPMLYVGHKMIQDGTRALYLRRGGEWYSRMPVENTAP